MTEALIENLRDAVVAYRRDGDDSHLLDWIHRVEVLRALRQGDLGNTYIHFFPRKENES
jgi:hypothetical protein